MMNNYIFKPNIILIIIMLILIGLFTRLGFWQLSRAEEKQKLEETIIHRNNLPPLSIERLMTLDTDLRFRKVVVRGVYKEEKNIFLDGKKHKDKIGYHVVTPLIITGTDNVQILVNRGWVKINKNGNTLPAISTPEGAVDVKGTIEFSSKPSFLSLHSFDDDRNWGVRWPFLDTDYYATQNNVQLQPFYILQDADDKSRLIREWPVFDARKNIHILIAIQWFTFVVITIGVFLGLSVTRKENKTEIIYE
jgi:surfeit locus 1 family protein